MSYILNISKIYNKWCKYACFIFLGEPVYKKIYLYITRTGRGENFEVDEMRDEQEEPRGCSKRETKV